ncbi:hypothetical protein BC351_18385 [Paenibacillus ferrarius]|uniref:Uncharacterized protein n=1 Tax=Paenibacillus ferrarius TaxID=1469647 RepID=A0A1V4HRD1_9BACL|nr:hypothetical protein [Paenibacillus ferrarius]OPH60458.1 hypothetical protein BC351_18385 [Paenibacillus ferrarius]
MEKIEKWKFPVSSNCICSGVNLTYQKGDAILTYDYYDIDNDDKVFNGGLIFSGTVAHRHSSEKFTKYIEGSYDTLLEITNSDWINELTTLSPDWAKRLSMKNFAIYLDSYGLFEFIAKDFIVMNIKEGEMEQGA